MALAELEDVSEAVRLAAKADLSAMPGAEIEAAAEKVQQLKAQLAALEAGVVAAYDTSMHWSLSAHRSAGAALRHRCRMRGGDAYGAVALARKLRTMPGTALAMADAVVTQSHARRLCQAATRPEFADGEAFLLRKATMLSFADWERAVTYWEQTVDEARQPDNPNEPNPPDPLEENRALHLSKTLAGMGRLDGWLDPVAHATLAEQLTRIETEMFKADWKLAKESHGDNTTVDKLWRTAAQRRADALVEMAVRSAAAPADGKRPRPLLILHADHDTFERAVAALAGAPTTEPLGTERMCELDDGTVISPTRMIELAVIGDVRRLIYRSPGVILDYGRKQRLFTGALREAICARDRRCAHVGCEIPARRCEIDHIIDWDHGGPTVHHNGKARCSYHHRNHKPRPG